MSHTYGGNHESILDRIGSRLLKRLAIIPNKALANKPLFVVIGTGRCGTGFISKYFSNAGIGCSHEAYYTVKGPWLRNGRRPFKTIGDASWLAVPFLPDPDVRVVHQVRNPWKVIRSFYNIGFFDQANYEKHKLFVDFARNYFVFSEDPLRSALRWYVEWNQHCESITCKRYQIENLWRNLDKLETWIGVSRTLPEIAEPSDINSRPSVVPVGFDEISDRLESYPEYPKLCEMADRYGYELPSAD